MPLVLLLAIGGAVFWFATREDDDSTPAAAVEAEGPSAPILAWAQAMADRHYETACSVMATAAVERLTVTGATCTAELERLNPDGLYDEAGSTEVLDEQVEGDRAQVTVRVGGSPLPQQPMAATREDGTWMADPFSSGG